MKNKNNANFTLSITLSIIICIIVFAVRINTDNKNIADTKVEASCTIEFSDTKISAYGCIDGDKIFITSSEYFDKYKFLDDGSSSEYNTLSKAMRNSGFTENKESVFTNNNGASAAIVAEMLNKRNIIISFDNKAFNEFCLR